MKADNVTVLLVEDDQNVRSTLKAMLREMGVSQVFQAGDGQEALKYFDANPDGVDMVICDWNMPHKTGIEFLREIRQVYPDMPFLMITARADKESIIAAKSAQVTAYIRKPFTFDELKDKIMVMMGK